MKSKSLLWMRESVPREFPGSLKESQRNCSLLSHVQLFVTPWTVACQALSPWDFPDKNTGMGCHFLLQGIFLTQWLNPGLLHCRRILYRLNHQGTVIRIHGFHYLSLGSIPGQGTEILQAVQPKKKGETMFPIMLKGWRREQVCLLGSEKNQNFEDGCSPDYKWNWETNRGPGEPVQ